MEQSELSIRLVDGRNIDFVHGGDVKFPPILYKYRDWTEDFHKEILTKNTIYFPPPSDFWKDDPRDCNLEREFLTDKELYDYFYCESFQRLHKNISAVDRYIWIYENYSNSPIRNPLERNKIIEDSNKRFNNMLGVLCLCKNPHSEKMWSQYSKLKGICYGFDTNKLMQIIRTGGPVSYCEVLPKLNYQKDEELNCMVSNLFFKDKKWEYEDELRLFKIAINKTRTLSNKDRTVELLKDTIVEIYLGKNMDDEIEKEIENLASILHPKANIIKLRKK